MSAFDAAGLLAAPFSLRSLTVTGEPFVVADNAGCPSVSGRNFTLLLIQQYLLKDPECTADEIAYFAAVSGDKMARQRNVANPAGLLIKTDAQILPGTELDAYRARKVREFAKNIEMARKFLTDSEVKRAGAGVGQAREHNCLSQATWEPPPPSCDSTACMIKNNTALPGRIADSQAGCGSGCRHRLDAGGYVSPLGLSLFRPCLLYPGRIVAF
jgi:hypothetical protein